MVKSRPTSRTPASQRASLEAVVRAADENLPLAIELAKQAQASGIADPFIHRLLAIERQQAGSFEEAITEAGLGLQLAPHDAELMTLVGFCLLELGRRQEAAQVFAAAIKADPLSAEANYGYGWAAERLGALEAADSAFARALALNPSHADAHAGKSGLAVRRRDWRIARAEAEAAILSDPRQTDALMNLARIDAGERNFAAAEQRLRSIIALEHLKPQARANARIMLGDALDAQGRHQEAFYCYSSGKAELRAQSAHLFERPDLPTAVDGVNRLLGEFLATPASDWATRHPRPTIGGEHGHAFLLGFPRSGTTLLEQILATHPLITTLEERPVLLQAEAEFLTRPGGISRLGGALGELLEPFREDYWRRVKDFGVKPNHGVFIDKHPLNTIRIPLIKKLFPSSKIIFALRDPRDVIFSCFRRSFNMNISMYQFNTLMGAATYYDAVMKAGSSYIERLELDVFFLRYEELVGDFDMTLDRLCEFLGISWNDSFRGFAEAAANRRIATPSSTQVGRGLYEDGIGQWRHYAAMLDPVLPLLEPWIVKFGYSMDEALGPAAA